MKKKLLFVFVLLISCFMIPVHAADENFMAGDDLKVDKESTSTAFVAGRNVEITSTIDGAAFVAGQVVKVSSYQDYLFVAGESVVLDHASTKDAFVAGNVLSFKDGSYRDVYAAGSSITIDTNINRNAYLAGDVVTINREIYGDVYIAADKIKLGDKAYIAGTMHYPRESKLDVSDSAKINNKKSYKGRTEPEVKVKLSFIDTVIIPGIISYFSILLVSFILLALGKKTFDKWEKEKKDAGTIFKYIGLGLAGLILVPIACGLVMITIIGIPLSLMVFCLYFMFLYLSIIPTAYYVGNWAFKDVIKNKYLLLAVSLLILVVLKMIPILGGFIGFVSLCFGLGMLIMLVKESIKLK